MRRSFLMITFALAALVGCGSDEYVRVRGSFTKGGKAVFADEAKDQWLQVTLIALGPDGKSIINAYGANVADNGGFDVPGPDGTGVPRGKYRVSVALVTNKNRGNDLFKKEFSDNDSPIVRDITSSTNLAIDLDKPTL